MKLHFTVLILILEKHTMLGLPLPPIGSTSSTFAISFCLLLLKFIFLIGCTKHPGDFKYCKEHKAEETPAVSSSKLNQDNKAMLRSAKQKNQYYGEQDFTDSVYIIQGAEVSKFLFYLVFSFINTWNPSFW